MPEPAPLPEPEASVRPLPVLAEPRPVERPAQVSLPAAVVAATGGFMLGVVSFILVRVLRRPRAAGTLRLRRASRRRNDIAASRSFLIDIHLLKDR